MPSGREEGGKEGRLTNDIEYEADEPMVRCKYEKNFINKNYVLEVVYHALPIQEIHGRPQEVPVERSCESKVFRPARNIGNGNHFFEGDDLDCGHNRNHVDMPRQHGGEEDGDHDERPYCSSDECLFLLLVL